MNRRTRDGRARGGRRSAAGTEILAGLTTFLTMSYIVVVNPQILGEAGLPFDAALTATVLAAAAGSVAMGLFARLPYALAPGMGINAFFTYDLVRGRGVTPEAALGLVVVSGAVFLLLSATSLRRDVARAIPVHLRGAVAGGIGVLLAFIGLQNAGLVVAHGETIVALGPLDVRHLLFLLGLLTAAFLHRQGRAWAFLAAIALATLLGIVFTDSVRAPEGGWARAPDLSLVFAADPAAVLDAALLAPLVTLLFTDLLDSLATLLGVAQAADLLDEDGEPRNVERALLVDAGATLVSGVFGTSPATTYVESTAGIEAGGRTGLCAVVAGLAFLPFAFFGPALAAVPAFATAPVLVMVGTLMMRSVGSVASLPLEERLPAFLVVIAIPLTFSITTGILVGFLLHTLLFLLAGRARDVRPMMWALGVLAALLLTLDLWS